jgi:PAS domain S-box-containing protein
MAMEGTQRDAATWIVAAVAAVFAMLSAAARTRRSLRGMVVGATMGVALLVHLRGEARERRRAADEAHRLAGEVEGRRSAEQALRDSERRFREVVEASPTALLLTDADGRIVLANPQAERLFGHEHGALLGLRIEALVPDALCDADPSRRASGPWPAERRAMNAGRRDLRGLRRDGTAIPIEVGLSTLGDGETRGVLAAIVDLSARHAHQHQLEAALREKTVLLDELHHRVKNTLQVILSLLSLQARGASPEARAALAETRNRIQAMALPHQLLLEHGDLAQLPLGEYLARLVPLLADAYRTEAPSVSLRTEGTDAPLRLELPRAIPCGLLVTELVARAARHAFPDGRPGSISVGLARDGSDARLWVDDDGIPAVDGASGAGPGAASIGAPLVPLLVEQLGGTVLRSGPGPAGGNRFELRFPAQAAG